MCLLELSPQFTSMLVHIIALGDGMVEGERVGGRVLIPVRLQIIILLL